MENTILDRFDDKPPAPVAMAYSKHYLALLILSIAISVAVYFDKEIISEKAYFLVGLFVFIVPVGSLIVGLVVAIFLDKRRSFWHRLRHGFTLSAIGILGVMLLMQLITLSGQSQN